jgi:hypothetical protein
VLPDPELLADIRRDLEASSFVGAATARRGLRREQGICHQPQASAALKGRKLRTFRGPDSSTNLLNRRAMERILRLA